MTYEEFKAEMQNLLNKGFKYSPDQAGFGIYAEKMADLAEAYPEFEERLDSEWEAAKDREPVNQKPARLK